MRWPATWLIAPKAPIWILLLASLVSLPSLFCGWMNDDYLHNLIITDRSPVPKVDDFSIYGQFSFVSGSQERINKIIDLGAFPWWTDTGTEVAFFRPLTEITHGFDYALWPNSPMLMHTQNIFWYLLLMFFAYRCFQQLFGNAALASSLALFLFALDGSNGMTVGWIANRSALLATCSALLAFWFHMRVRANQSNAFWAAPLLFLISLLCAEYGVTLLAFLFSYSVFVDKGNLRARALSLLPYFIILIFWSWFYRSHGFGTQDSGNYLDPFGHPREYFAALPDRLVLLLQAQLNAVSLLGQAHTSKVTLIKAGYILLTLLLFLPALVRSSSARFFLAGGVLALLPIAAAYPEDRVLLFSGFGFSGVLAEFFIFWFDKTKRPNYPKLISYAVGFLTWIMVLLHIIISPLSFIPSYELPFIFSRSKIQEPALALPFDESIKDKTVIFLNPPMAMLGSYFSAVRMVNRLPIPEKSYFLASGQHDIEIKRMGSNSLLITPDTGFLQIDFDYYSRSIHKLFKVGDKLHLSGMDVEITKVGPIGEPMQAIFSFKVPLEDPSLVWLKWDIDEINKTPHYIFTQPKEFAEP